MEFPNARPQIEERLPWHQPEIQRLVVSLDTKFGTGSAVDCENHAASVDTDVCEM
jgi:hypothetical protein